MNEQQIFKAGSTTYYWSSKFFPSDKRKDVFRLYSFVRVVDNSVDEVPQDLDSFSKVKKAWGKYKKSDNPKLAIKALEKPQNKLIMENIIYLVQKYSFEHSWVDAFLDSMQMDADGRDYQEIDDTLGYIYGSAEVIGLMMAQILGLPKSAQGAARLQGRAMQMINFIRDIDEDNSLNRCYFPKKDLKKFGLANLNKNFVQSNKKSFSEFVKFEIELYRKWQLEADVGMHFIPKRHRIPIKTARDMYNWTAEQIYQNPMIVYEKKVKPSKYRVTRTVLKNSIYG